MDRFARLIHGLDFVLEALRGDHRAELTVITDDYSYASGHHGPRDTRNKSGGLGPDCADANPAGLPGYTSIANHNIITARGEIDTGRKAHRNIVAASGVTR